MSFNGSGTYSRLYSWITDRNNGDPISATKMDAEMDGMATALSTAICRDGQSTITAAIPFNNQKITGLGDAAADTDGLNRRSGDSRFARLQGGSLSPASSVSASEVDLSNGRCFSKTVTGATTWTFTNWASSGLDGFVLYLSNGGTGTQTWPASVRWPGGRAPSFTTSGTDILVFITKDGGTTVDAKMTNKDSA